MINLKKTQSIEMRGHLGQPLADKAANLRIFGLFLVLVAGIIASWFWDVGWHYLADTTQGFKIGPPLAIAVRVILSLIAAAVTFVSMYNKIDQNSQESWIPYFVAFQNGFFWDALFQSAAGSFLSA